MTSESMMEMMQQMMMNGSYEGLTLEDMYNQRFVAPGGKEKIDKAVSYYCFQPIHVPLLLNYYASKSAGNGAVLNADLKPDTFTFYLYLS